MSLSKSINHFMVLQYYNINTTAVLRVIKRRNMGRRGNVTEKGREERQEEREE